MPRQPPKSCLDCGALTHAARCDDCAAARNAGLRDPRRASIYRTPRWRAARRAVLEAQPYCPGWPDGPCGALATHVDHVTPLRDDGDPYDEANLQGLCVPCHSRKTAHEVGWGRAR